MFIACLPLPFYSLIVYILGISSDTEFPSKIRRRSIAASLTRSCPTPTCSSTASPWLPVFPSSINWRSAWKWWLITTFTVVRSWRVTECSFVLANRIWNCHIRARAMTNWLNVGHRHYLLDMCQYRHANMRTNALPGTILNILHWMFLIWLSYISFNVSIYTSSSVFSSHGCKLKLENLYPYRTCVNETI